MSKIPWWLNIAGKTLLVILIITLIILGWCWITKDFDNTSLSDRFFISGAIAILIGLASVMGNWKVRSDWRQIFTQSSGQANLHDRNSLMLADVTQAYATAVIWIFAGLISIIIAVLIGQSA